ncbi:4-coumarate--CoA ligase 1-like [Colletes gigas]|uniref:4-coumarate--CoA ligase 1-like n=1 Tax=Colletes gigas TaxID=935657 RepID=UPI001C9B67E4|nr:4-coumarate--CoA ligase 1-like [Colletes gigas]XP_043257833.1 4-coumarate--CoA ligase 1-like [Colletes gigas]
MKVLDNIIHGPPGAKVPNISIQEYILSNLRAKLDHILQVDIETGKSFTSKDVLVGSVALASALKNYGIEKQDRISISSENLPNFLIATCAIYNVGAVFAPLNPGYTEREYRHMLEITQPRVMFVSRKTEVLLSKIAPTLSWTMKLIHLEDSALTENIPTLKNLVENYKSTVDPYKFVPAQIGDSSKEMAAILASSGTTGLPKGVTLSHRNLLTFFSNSSGPKYVDIQRGDRIMMFLPMFHGYAFGVTLIATGVGATTYVLRSFNVETLLEAIEKYKITYLPLVPPVLVLLAKHPTVTNYDFSSVRYLMCGAAPFPKDVADEVKRRTKIKCIHNGYGMTELSVISHISDIECNDENVGLLVPGFLCKVVNPETNETLPTGDVGEVCLKGDQVMLGYFKNPKVTAETIDDEKWLHTGDLGYFKQDGLLYITGRLKEIIKYKAYQVSPSEIETVIQSHPGVKDAAVVGKPDKMSGEVPMALVVKQPGSNVTAKEIIDFTNRNLSPQKWLRGGVIFVEAIPKNPSGKILRRELIKLIAKL